MKNLKSCTLAVLTAIFTVFAPQKGLGQSPTVTPPQMLQIGTVEKVTEYAVSKINDIGILFRGYSTNGAYDFNFSGHTWQTFSNSPTFSNLSQISEFVRSGLTNVMQGFLNFSDPRLDPDKTKGLKVNIVCDMIIRDFNISDTILYSEFAYICPKFENGAYVITEMPLIPLYLHPRQIPFYFPKIDWARVEIGYKGDPTPFQIYDNRIDPSTDPIDSDGFLYLDTDVITSCSKANGLYWLKLAVCGNNYFQSFDGDGLPLPEQRLMLSLSKKAGQASVTVSGGDSGRAYFLQSSGDLKNWTRCSPVTFVSPYSYYDSSTTFTGTATNKNMFYRTVCTNTPPY